MPLEDAHAVIEKMKKIENPDEWFIFLKKQSFRWADQIKDLGFHGNFQP